MQTLRKPPKKILCKYEIKDEEVDHYTEENPSAPGLLFSKSNHETVLNSE